jgi:hypothetical protein
MVAVRFEMTVILRPLLFPVSRIVSGVHVQDETILPFLLDQGVGGSQNRFIQCFQAFRITKNVILQSRSMDWLAPYIALCAIVSVIRLERGLDRLKSGLKTPFFLSPYPCIT